MNYEIEYEIFKYICKEIDEYVSLQELLNNNGLTFKEALVKTADYYQYYFDMLERYGINMRNSVSVCTDLMNLLEKSPEDTGLLLDCNQAERSDEQNIKNWIEQKKRTDELIEFHKENMKIKKHFNEFVRNMKAPY